MVKPIQKIPEIPLNLENLCQEVLSQNQPVYFHFRGHQFALLSAEELRYLESLEEENDIQCARISPRTG
ncbi:MAG: hypothetical protein ACE15F_12345 [bacterium]